MNINFYKSRSIFFIIAAAFVALAVAVFFIFGFASDNVTKGYTEYKAVISSEADLAELDEYLLYDKVNDVVGSSAAVVLTSDMVTYETVLLITVPYGSQIDEQGVVTMLDTDYADFAVDSLVVSNYGPSAESAFYLSFIAAVFMVLVVLFVISLFFISTRNACVVLVGELVAALMTTGVYLFARVASFMLLIASVFASVILSFVLGIIMVKAIEKTAAVTKKPKQGDVMNAAINGELGRAVTLLIIGALVAVAFTIIGLVFSYVGLVSLGAMLFTVLLMSLFTTTLLVPSLWTNK